MKVIDLRSDTVTQPTLAMMKAIATAPLGDDVFREDPTVNRLEKMAAEIMGKEAALFVASGTMANLISQMTHCGRGDEMILGDQSHIFFYEQGGSSAIGGIHPRTLPNQPDGTIDLAMLEAAVRDDNIHFPRTRLIVLENTHNRCNGSPLPIDYLNRVRALANKYKLLLHIDGARIFNAATALGVEPDDLVGMAESVKFCVRYVLAAPAGSLVCGSLEMIARARRLRKVLGGGMRQSGILAAAGITALETMTQRLTEDHENAAALAEGLAKFPNLSVNPDLVKTNIVYVDIPDGDLSAIDLVTALSQEGVKFLPTGLRQFRLVTHYQVREPDIRHVLRAFHKVLS